VSSHTDGNDSDGVSDAIDVEDRSVRDVFHRSERKTKVLALALLRMTE